jgi:hypothetical protein
MRKCNIKVGDFASYVPTEEDPNRYPTNLQEGYYLKVESISWQGVIGLDKFVKLNGIDKEFPSERLQVVL